MAIFKSKSQFNGFSLNEVTLIRKIDSAHSDNDDPNLIISFDQNAIGSLSDVLIEGWDPITHNGNVILMGSDMKSQFDDGHLDLTTFYIQPPDDWDGELKLYFKDTNDNNSNFNNNKQPNDEGIAIEIGPGSETGEGSKGGKGADKTLWAWTWTLDTFTYGEGDVGI